MKKGLEGDPAPRASQRQRRKAGSDRQRQAEPITPRGYPLKTQKGETPFRTQTTRGPYQTAFSPMFLRPIGRENGRGGLLGTTRGVLDRGGIHPQFMGIGRNGNPPKTEGEEERARASLTPPRPKERRN